MSGRGGTVLLASLVVSSPVLWLVWGGDLSTDDAVKRWGICLVLCWLAISVAGELFFPATTNRGLQREPAGRGRASVDEADLTDATRE
jgi:hypothetical protein